MEKQFFQKKKRGFTLVELIVVIAIVAILAAVSIAGYYGFINYANQSAADQEGVQFRKAILSQMAMSYKGKTSSISSIVGVSNNKGIRIYSEVGEEHPETKSLYLLGEAYTYVEAPDIYNALGFSIDFSGAIICNGEKTDGEKPAIYSPKVLEVNEGETINYFITEVTYQSKFGYESVVKFADSVGAYEVEVSNVNSMSNPTSIAVVGGLKDSYYANEFIDTSNIKALVTFEDGKSAVVGSESLNVSIITTSGISPANKSVLNISSKNSTRSVGSVRKVIVEYVNSKGVAVSNETENPKVFSNSETLPVDSNDVILSKPANILESERVKNIDPNKQAGFFRDPNDSDFKYHFVGLDNEFIFEPQVSVIKNGQKFNIIVNNEDISHSLYLVDGDNETLVNNMSEYFTYINDDKTKLQFNNEVDDNNKHINSVEGHYKLETTIFGKSFDTYLKVVDGFNAYNINDLKLFDNTNIKNASNAGNSDIGTDPDLSMSYISPYIVKDGNTATSVTNSKYYNECTNDSAHNRADHGLILQNNIKITANAFDKHIYREDGKIAYPEEDVTLCFFKRNLPGNVKWNFEGNYYTIDASSVPLKHFGYVGADPSQFRSPYLFAFAYDYNLEYEVGIDENFFGRYKEVNFNRVNIVGNSPKSNNVNYAGGMKIVNVFNLTKFNCKYVNIKQGFMAYELNHNSCGGNIMYSKAYDCWNCVIDNYGGYTGYNARNFYAYNAANNKYLENLDQEIVGENLYNAFADASSSAPKVYEALNQGLHIDHCEFKNAGGPVIMNQNSEPKSDLYISTVDIKNSELESVISGTEGFFQLYPQTTSMFPTIKGLFNDVDRRSANQNAMSKEGYLNLITMHFGGYGFGGDNNNDSIQQLLGNIDQKLIPQFETGLNPSTDKHHVVGYSFASSVNEIINDPSEQAAAAQALQTTDKKTIGAYLMSKEILNPTFDAGANNIEARNHVSIDDIKYINIDHTTIGIDATHGIHYMVRGANNKVKQIAPSVDTSTLECRYDVRDAYVTGDNQNTYFLQDTQTPISDKISEFFEYENKYLGMMTNTFGIGFIFGLFNK